SEKGCIAEAGVFKGGSSAKFSLAAKYAKRELILFDSFQGLPENTELHEQSILGHSITGWFKGGAFCGGMEEVKHNIGKYGEITVCKFIKGWFDDTMPLFKEKIAAAYIDVDLASSTKTCLKYLYPLLIPGGVLYSQDGDFPLVIQVFDDDHFWENEVGCKKPCIEGLGTQKLIRITKPLNSQ
ncbi:MAG: TylF/MycF/NovP-related O-methyltransferase, partial [Deltaproteobacteria bacterium]